MRMLLVSLIVSAALMALWIMLGAAPEVSILQRIILSAIPLSVSILIAWLAWEDAVKPVPTPSNDA